VGPARGLGASAGRGGAAGRGALARGRRGGAADAPAKGVDAEKAHALAVPRDARVAQALVRRPGVGGVRVRVRVGIVARVRGGGGGRGRPRGGGGGRPPPARARTRARARTPARRATPARRSPWEREARRPPRDLSSPREGARAGRGRGAAPPRPSPTCAEAARREGSSRTSRRRGRGGRGARVKDFQNRRATKSVWVGKSCWNYELAVSWAHQPVESGHCRALSAADLAAIDTDPRRASKRRRDALHSSSRGVLSAQLPARPRRDVLPVGGLARARSERVSAAECASLRARARPPPPTPLRARRRRSWSAGRARRSIGGARARAGGRAGWAAPS
jgi:hypothetical protein